MKKFAKLAAAAAIAGLAFASNAALVIDDFSTAQTKIEDVNGSDFVGAHSEVSGAGIIGGYRDLFVIKTSPTGAADDLGVNLRVSTGGKLVFSEDDGAKGFGVVRWDGQNAGGVNASNFLGALNKTGLGGLDLLAAGSAFHLSVASADSAFPFLLGVYTDNSNYSILELTSSGLGEYTIPFAAFALGLNVGNGADFSSVGAMEAYINFDSINLVGKAASIDLSVEIVDIPEPGTMALAGLALVGLGAIRRRKQAA